MQDLHKDLTEKPALSLDLLALAEEHHLPKTAAACERFIAESYSLMPDKGLQSISKAACQRIIRALAVLNANSTRLKIVRSQGYTIYELPSADTLLSWR